MLELMDACRPDTKLSDLSRAARAVMAKTNREMSELPLPTTSRRSRRRCRRRQAVVNADRLRSARWCPSEQLELARERLGPRSRSIEAALRIARRNSVPLQWRQQAAIPTGSPRCPALRLTRKSNLTMALVVCVDCSA
jgi:hypothetical protein